MRCSWIFGALGALVACNAGPESGTDTDSDAAPASPFDGVAPVARYGAPMADAAFTALDGRTIAVRDWWQPGGVLIVYAAPDTDYHRTVLGGDWEGLVEDLPADTRVVFAAYGDDPDDRAARLDAMQADLSDAAGVLGVDVSDRIAIVEDDPAAMGWVSALGAPNVRRTDAYHGGHRFIGFAVDPSQRIRPLGELVDWARSRTRLDWLGLEAVALRHEHARLAALPEATEVVVFDAIDAGTGWDGPGVFADVALPEDLAGFEGLEVRLDMGCFHVEAPADGGEAPPNVGDLDCPEWDRLTHLYLCSATDPDVCDVELGRWITPYTKDGVWVHDITPLLPLLGDGGTRRFRYKAIDRHETTVTLRFIDDDARPRPLTAIPLVRGGALHAETNLRYAEPVEVPVPANAVSAEVVAVISGHSFGKDTRNCAEFCDHQHTFTVGEASVTRTHPAAGTAYGCQLAVGEGSGVTANQYGSWPFGRGGWCPGAAVEPWRAEVTAGVTPGGTVSVGYRVQVAGADYDPTWLDPSDSSKTWEGEGLHPPGIWVPEVNMQSWLVTFAAPAR